MNIEAISKEEKHELELRHRHEGDGRVRDRIKAVLLKSEGWENKAIAQALRIHEDTVRQHLNDWTEKDSTICIPILYRQSQCARLSTRDT